MRDDVGGAQVRDGGAILSVDCRQCGVWARAWVGVMSISRARRMSAGGRSGGTTGAWSAGCGEETRDSCGRQVLLSKVGSHRRRAAR